MKKKLLCVVVAVAMVMSLVAGCGNASKTEGTTEAAAEAAAVEKAPAEEAVEAEGLDISNIIVAEVHYSVVEDGGWAQAMHEGLMNACEALGMDTATQVLTYEEVAEEDTALIESTVEEAVENGAKIIFGCSAGYVTIFSELAEQYPDVIFAQQGNDVYDNIVEMQIRGYEGEFLAGYLCGLMNEDSDEFGFCASMLGDASVRTALNGYTLGVKYANPNAVVNVVEANSWYDYDIEAANAESLINKGIMYMGMEASSPGIPEKCQEKGAFCIGYNIDMQPNAPEAVLTSFCWNWAPIFQDIIQRTVDGTISVSDNYYEGGECSAIAPINTAIVPQEIIDKVEAAKADLLDGKLAVYAGELKDNQGNILVEAGSTMEDSAILAQEFYVEGVEGVIFE